MQVYIYIHVSTFFSSLSVDPLFDASIYKSQKEQPNTRRDKNNDVDSLKKRVRVCVSSFKSPMSKGWAMVGVRKDLFAVVVETLKRRQTGHTHKHTTRTP